MSERLRVLSVGDRLLVRWDASAEGQGIDRPDGTRHEHTPFAKESGLRREEQVEERSVAEHAQG